MADNFNLYNLAWAVEYCTALVNAISDTVDTKNYGLDSDADYNKYYNKIYDLYDLALKNNAVDEVIAEIKDDGADPSLFIEIKEEQEGFRAQEEQEALARSVEVGDYVQLYNGNRFYVCNREGRSLWVTKNKADRTNSGALGWHADLYDIVEILERYEDIEE